MSAATRPGPDLRRRLSLAVALVLVVGALWAAVEGVGRVRDETAATYWTIAVPVHPTADMPDDGWDRRVAPYDLSPLSSPTPGVLLLGLEDTDPVTAAMATAPAWAGWFATAAAALVLAPAARRLAAGRPSSVADARAVLGAAGVVLLAWAAVHAMTVQAARRALAADQTLLPASWFRADLDVQWWPVLVAGVLVVLAASVRRSAHLVAAGDATA